MPDLRQTGLVFDFRDGSAALCARIESPKRVGTKGAGWIHKLKDGDTWRGRRRIRRVTIPARANADGGADFARLAERYKVALSVERLKALAMLLGVSMESLTRLGVGWDGRAFTFPMTGFNAQVVGIRRRFPSGRKLSVRGGREGLFVPPGVGFRDPFLGDDGTNFEPLYVCEGPTDTAALLDLGFSALGRPSCRGGVGLVRNLAQGF